MIAEHDQVVLTMDIAEHGLRAGDIGTIVMVHRQGESYEVEFMTLVGETLGVVTLPRAGVRPIQPGEIAHARSVQAA
jgi:hypothetical protein